MEFLLLGPLEVRADDRVLPLGGAKQRALLALLLLHPNEVVPRDRLIDELWGERAPESAKHSLDVEISRLRKTLAPADIVVTRSGGYVLDVEPDEIDVHRFERLLEEGRRANAASNPAEAAQLLRDALALWRGGALADLAYEPFARLEVERLEELRLVAFEERFDAELALGQHDALVPELESLAARHPLRERLRAQLMLALYRSGRQAEALRVYADTRRRLVQELGLEPGRALQELEQAILRHDPSLGAPPVAASETSRRRRRRTMVAAIGLPLAAGASVGAILLAAGETQSSHARDVAQPDSVALVSAGSGKVIAGAAARAPLLSSFGEGSLWNVSLDGELTRIDPASGKTLATLGLGITHPGGIAVGEGSVWVTDCCSPTLVRVDPNVNPPVAERIQLPTHDVQPVTATGEVAVGAGSVWVAHGYLNPLSWVERLDPRTGRVQHRFLIQGGAQALAFGDGAAWVVGGEPGYLTKIDARMNKITATVHLHGYMCCVAVGGGFVWAAITPNQAVWKISAAGKVLTSLQVGGNIENLAYADGGVWASDGEAGTVVRIDATTNAKRTYRLGHHLLGVAARKGLVAVAVQQSAEDVTAGLKGRIAHVALKNDWLETPDPVFTPNWNIPRTLFQYATCAKLLNYPDVSGPAGRTLVPEVAATLPAVSDGGRTYTFRIRGGFGFSPPSHEQVSAETFRHVIERMLSPKLADNPFVSRPVAEVVGAEAYRSGKAQHVSGVSARGDTLSIRLTKPAPDLPRRLALPAFCAVPLDTPAAPDGVDSVIPSAGPYYLAAHAGNAYVLKPNPNYGGSRPRRLDAIVFRVGVDVGTAAALIAQRRFDYVIEIDPALAPDTAAARAAGRRYRQVPTNGTNYLAFNTSRPLFADIRLRRAVADALDRRALDPDAYSLPATRLLPPRLAGSGAAPTHPLRPDLHTARRLMGGRHVHAVFATYDPAIDEYAAAFAKAVRQQLAAIGISVTILPLTFADNDDPAKMAAKLARADLVGRGSNADEADPVLYLQSLPYLPAADRTRLDRIAKLSSPERDTEAAALAAQLEREEIYAVYSYGAIPELVSARLGCVVHQPEVPGVDLAALCLPKEGRAHR